MSQIELSEKELKILIRLLSDHIIKNEHSEKSSEECCFEEEYNMLLLDKLETVLKLSEFESFLGIKDLPNNKYIN